MRNVIVALDDMTAGQALSLAIKLTKHPHLWGFKVNDLLLRHGATILQSLKRYGNVFADPKLYDIPNTMTNSVKTLVEHGADIITVHLQAEYIPSAKHAHRVAGVTTLTSSDGDVSLQWLETAAQAGYGYVVCSGLYARMMKSRVPDVKVICPGIRPAWAPINDQKAVVTPQVALGNGADLLVIGRPITTATDPVAAMDRLFEPVL
jgi:orotidine-5'-phosphate decarboxylase